MAIRVRMVAAAAGAIGLVLATAPGASADPGHWIKNHNSGRCLEIGGWATNDGAPADQWDCFGNPNQTWNVTSSDGPIINDNSQKCLEVADWRTDNGAPVRQWTCTGGANQSWRQYLNNGIVYLINDNAPGKCLEINGWATGNGGVADIWDCNQNGINQQWFM